MINNRKNRWRLVWLLVLALTGVTAAGIGLWMLARRASRPPLPVLGAVPDFALTERSGRTVTRADLASYVWVADFVFTRCPGPCPLMTAKMAQLRKSLGPSAARVRLVSFTVDPGYDTPAVLSEYADRFGAEKDRWWFLTGKKEAIYRLATEGFHLAVRENPDEMRLPSEGPVIHSTRFVLVDAQGRIRGYYDSDADDVLSQLLRDIGILLREKNS